MLDYETPDESGTLVGSQLLAVSSSTPITLHSEHGATVLVLTRKGAPLPVPAAPGAAGPGSDSSSEGTADK